MYSSDAYDYPDDEIYTSDTMLREYEFQERLIQRLSTGEINQLIEEGFNVTYPSNIGLE
jgi:hypothetical protein